MLEPSNAPACCQKKRKNPVTCGPLHAHSYWRWNASMELQNLDRRDHPGASALPPADGLLLEQFANERNQDAFATLMERHGPYVLGVCRRLTYHAQDAEDVFQACFLELVRNAWSIRQGNSVAGWLQTVAVRKARLARTRRERQQQREVSNAVENASVSDRKSTRLNSSH